MESTTPSSRRQFLKLSGLAGAASMLPFNQAAASSLFQPSGQPLGQAKSVIFLVVDGLCNGTVGLAHHWKLRNEQMPLNWIKLFDREDMYRAYQDTASASSPVTDSAAAASAWGSGRRVNNGSINVDTSGKPLKPILSYANKASRR